MQPIEAVEGAAEIKTCRDCGETFNVTVEQATWFAERGAQHPKRCQALRRIVGPKQHEISRNRESPSLASSWRRCSRRARSARSR